MISFTIGTHWLEIHDKLGKNIVIIEVDNLNQYLHQDCLPAMVGNLLIHH